MYNLFHIHNVFPVPLCKLTITMQELEYLPGIQQLDTRDNPGYLFVGDQFKNWQ